MWEGSKERQRLVRKELFVVFLLSASLCKQGEEEEEEEDVPT